MVVYTSTRSRDETLASFDKVDRNGSKRLSALELQELLETLGLLSIDGSGDAEYETMMMEVFMEKADANEDGLLDFEEFWIGLMVWDAANETAPASAAGDAKRCAWFDGSRFEPLMVVAIANFVASIWEDVFDRTQAKLVGEASDHGDWENVGFYFGHFVVVVLLCTVLRAGAVRIGAPRARVLVMTSLQILTGWGAVYFLKYFVLAIQDELVGTSSYCDGWLAPTCWLVCTCIAVLVTGVGALTAFLPTTPPPKRLSLTSLKLHAAVLLTGAMALPLAYAWHLAFDDFLRTITLRLFTTACDDGDGRRLSSSSSSSSDGDDARFSPQAVEWFVHSLFEVGYAVAVAFLCAALKRRVTAHCKRMREGASSDESQSIAFRLSNRMQVLGNKTAEFLLAWAIFDIVMATYSTVDSSPCFPSHGGGLTEPWLTMLVWAIVLLSMGVLRASRLATCGLGRLEACLRGPPLLCGRELPALAWGIVLNGLGIQLGWTVHVMYLKLETKFVEEDHQDPVAITLLGASLATVTLIAAFHTLTARRRLAQLASVAPAEPTKSRSSTDA